MLNRRPAVRIVIPFAIGILVGWNVVRDVHIPYLFVAAAAATLGSLFLPERFRSILLPLLLVAAGAIAISTQTARNRDLAAIPHLTQLRCTGVITQKPVRRERTLVTYLELDSIAHGRGMRPVSGLVRVSITAAGTGGGTIRTGAVVELKGEFRHPQGARNPGEFDYGAYCQLHGIDGILRVTSIADVQVRPGAGPASPGRWMSDLREHVGSLMDANASPIVAALLKGLVIGERSELPDEVRQAFTNSGLMHILAVSGFNVGLVVMILSACGSLLRVPRRVHTVVTAAGLVGFMYLTGAEASVARATIMALAFLGARWVERSPDVLNTLGFAALVALFIDPATFFDIGFQLSFAAVLALALVVTRIEEFLDRIPKVFRQNIVVRYIIGSMVVSVAASVGTTPITALYFHKVSFIGLFLNLIAVPVSGVMLGIGFIMALTGAFLPGLCAVYAHVAELLGTILLNVTLWGGSRPYASLDMGMTIWEFAATYGVVAAWIGWNRREVRTWSLIVALVIANLVAWRGVLTSGDRVLRVAVIDVGQGDAILVTTPSGSSILVDAGPLSFKSDAGLNTVVPYLRHSGVTGIDRLIITHTHADHAGGVPSVLASMPVRELLIPTRSGRSPLLGQIDSLCHARSVRTIEVDSSRLYTDCSGMRLYVLHARSDGGRPLRGQNDNSIVVKIVYGKTSILLMGDAEAGAEKRFAHAFGRFMKADLLKAGHHGSSTSSSVELIDLVHPEVVLISVGERNKFGHPSPGTVRKFTGRRVTVERTDREGALLWESDGEGWRKVWWK